MVHLAQILWDGDHHEIVLRAVQEARVSVWIATANLKDVHVRGRSGRYVSILGEFDRLAACGVELRMLHASMPSKPFRASFDRFDRLVRGGLQLRQCPRVHLKMVIVDAQMLYVGSANWTGAGLGVKADGRRNFEVGWITRDEHVIDDAQANFQRIWDGSRCRDCQLRSSCEAPLDLGSAPRPGRRKRLVRVGRA